MLPLWCNSSPISASPSSLQNNASQPIKASAVSLLYLADHICLPWGYLSSGVYLTVNSTPIAPQQITSMHIVKAVMFHSCTSHLKIPITVSSVCFFCFVFFVTESLATCNMKDVGLCGYLAGITLIVILLFLLVMEWDEDVNSEMQSSCQDAVSLGGMSDLFTSTSSVGYKPLSKRCCSVCVCVHSRRG